MNLQQLISTLQNVVTGINALTQTISASTGAIFPQTSGTSMTAAAGAVASPGNFVGFLTVTLPDGTTAKVPYFS